MQELNLNELDELFGRAMEGFKDGQRKLHEELAVIAKGIVDKNIAGTVRDTNGKVRSWQEKHVGSGGGYAAVRATSAATGNNSPGAITNYLESGHAIRRPSGGKNYRPRIKTPYVSGRHFYQKSVQDVESAAIAQTENFVSNLAKQLEG